MKFCIDCKHYILEDSIKTPDLGRCAQNRSISLVTGVEASTNTLPFCKVQRLSHEPCGEDGKLFEPKTKLAESWATHGHIWIGEVMGNKESGNV